MDNFYLKVFTPQTIIKKHTFVDTTFQLLHEEFCNYFCDLLQVNNEMLNFYYLLLLKLNLKFLSRILKLDKPREATSV